jgi:hypothetical protein
VVDFPVDAVLAEPGEYVHLYGFVVAAEHSSEPVAEWHYGAVEDTIGTGNLVASDDGILREPPHYVGTSCRTFFPGHF